VQIDNAGAIALIGLLGASAVGLAKGLADMFTMAVPDRPTWAAPLVAMAGAIGLVFLTAVAYGVPLNAQTSAVCVLAGLGAGLGAAGITATGNTAEHKRLEAKSPPPPTDHF
jgi:hypothetical protein